MSGIISLAMKKGLLREHLQYLRMEYKQRMDLATTFLMENLPKKFHFEAPHGGYFIWIQGPENFIGEDFAKKASENGVEVLPGQRAAGNRLEPKKNRNAIRLSIAYYERDNLLEGCRRLCHVLSMNH